MYEVKKIFNRRCLKWADVCEINKLMLESIYSYYSTVFEICGFVFLRDIYAELGLPVTQESCVLGWHKDDSEHIKISIRQIDNSPDFEITFRCNPILEKIERESKVVSCI